MSIKPFFAHALAATAGVILLPLLVVFGLLAVLDPDPPVLLAAVLGVALAVVMMVIGNAIWSRRSEASDIGFSELMLWHWARRRHAEDELAHGARLLGLDRSGQPIDDVRIAPEQQLQVLKDLTAALESKDPYTHGHSQRVERHAYRTAAAMGLSAEDLEDLRKAAALHDVGKIRVPDRILRKAGPLTSDERIIVEEHAVVGAWMVSSVGNADVIAAVRHHHERWDGAGYPDGLSGADVPLFARVISVADAFDAITSSRPYRASAGRDEAVAALRADAGTHFDPEVVETFVESLPSRIPLAAGLFLMLGGPGRLARQIGLWFRRLGAGSLTPAAGATGAAIVLGASIFTPNVVDAGPSYQKGEVVRASETPQSLVVDGKNSEVKGKLIHDKKDDKKDNKKKRSQKSRKDGKGRDRSGASGATDHQGDNNSGPITASAPDGNGGNDGGSGGGSNPEPPKPPESEEKSGVDENPNDERDQCDSDGNAGHGNDDKDC